MPRRPQTEEDEASRLGLGYAVTKLRRDQNLSREEVAKRGGLTTDTITALEAKGQEPTWGNLRRVAQGLKVEMEELCSLAVELAPGKAGGRLRRREREVRQRREKRLQVAGERQQP
jgi:transcriptional regulator with XRE-family HTH domain